MPDPTGVLARPLDSHACGISRVPVYRAGRVEHARRIQPQQAIVLRDAGRALLAVAASDVAMEVPELLHIDALQDYQDDLFVAGYFDETFQKQVDTEYLAHDVRALAQYLTAVGQEVSLHAFEEIVATARRVASGSRQKSVSTLAVGVSRVVATLMQELQSQAVA